MKFPTKSGAASPDGSETQTEAKHGGGWNMEQGEILINLVRSNDLRGLGTLILNGADINYADEFGNTALFYGVANGNLEIVNLLISNGAEVNDRFEGDSTLLHVALEQGSREVVEEILKRCSDVNAKDVHGNSAIWTAVFNARGNYDNVRLTSPEIWRKSQI